MSEHDRRIRLDKADHPLSPNEDLSTDESRLLRLFRCLISNERHETLRTLTERLLKRYPVDPSLPHYQNPERAGKGELEEALEERLFRAMPYASSLTDLRDYDYPLVEHAWGEGEDFLEVLLGSSDNDAAYAEELVESYLEGIHEFALPLLTDFGASEEEMRADLLQETIQFLHEWRERIVAQLEQGAFPIRRHERNRSRSTRSNSHGDIIMHDEDSEAENVGQRRLTQVFKFLKELNELRNPVPRDMSAYTTVLRIDTWPVHPFVEVRRGDRAEEDDNVDGEGKLEPIICIRRAGLTSCPTPPEVLDDWLKPGWQMVEAEVEVVASRNFPYKENGSITVEFTEDEKRITALNAWEVARTKWAVAERPAVAARQLFERIHALWTTMQREGDRVELVVADGMLDLPDRFIRHPVLLQRVNLEFDPSGPAFCFNTGTEKVELHRALLRLVPSIEGRMIAQFDKELEVEQVEPLGGESTNGFLRRLVQGLFTDGEFLDGKAHGTASSSPSMWRE